MFGSSLLHFQLYFRELTFEQLAVNYKKPIFTGQNGDITFTEPDDIFHFLKQFDRFKLVDSRFVFYHLLEILARPYSRINVFNQKNRHRAQGSYFRYPNKSLW